MPRPSSQVGDAYRIRLSALDRTRRRIEGLLTASHVTESDAERVYEALFLNMMTSFEAFLEELFVGLMVDHHGLISGYLDVHARATVRSHKVARELILGTHEYVEWLPFPRTQDRAKAFFTGGRPFSTLPAAQTGIVLTCYRIRNAIAHQSDHAKRIFEAKVIGSTPLAPRERTPAGYLRSAFTAYPLQTRYEHFASQLLQAARMLSK